MLHVKMNECCEHFPFEHVELETSTSKCPRELWPSEHPFIFSFASAEG